MICGTHSGQTTDRHQFTGHERDPGNLDYMHARYYSPVLGRFLSVDPIGGYTGSQSLNLFSYVTNNPLQLVDPSGMYEWAPVAECGDQCKANRAAFRSALEKNLNSKDESIKATALAYGAEGESNGVIVTFGNPGEDIGGKVEANMNYDQENNGYNLRADVTFDPNISGAELQALVGHEGSHLIDAKAFGATFRVSETSATWDVSKNLTTRETETRAFGISHAVLLELGKPEHFRAGNRKGEVVLGKRMSPGKLATAIADILKRPIYAVNIDQHQIPQFDWVP